MSLIPLLLLTEGRMFRGAPEDGGEVRAAVAAGRVRDGATLHAYLLGRLSTAGLTAAAFAAAAALDLAGGIVVSGGGRLQSSALEELDAEFEARVPAPAQRACSRALGRHVIEAVRAGWPSPVLDAVSLVHPDGPHRPVAFGAAGTVAGLDAPSVAAAAALGEVTGAAAQAAALLGLDPDEVTAVLAGLASVVEDVAVLALKAARGPADELPALWAPLLAVGTTDAAARTGGSSPGPASLANKRKGTGTGTGSGGTGTSSGKNAGAAG